MTHLWRCRRPCRCPLLAAYLGVAAPGSVAASECRCWREGPTECDPAPCAAQDLDRQGVAADAAVAAAVCQVDPGAATAADLWVEAFVVQDKSACAAHEAADGGVGRGVGVAAAAEGEQPPGGRPLRH